MPTEIIEAMFTGAFAVVWIILAILMLVFWILTLVHQARRKRWVWFVLTLVFGYGIIFILYWIVWLASPEFRRVKPKK